MNGDRLPYPVVKATGETIEGRAVWRLEDEFTILLPFGRGVYALTIPAGFETDFASVPTWLHSIVSPTRPDILVAALVHDDLYRHGGRPATTTTNGQTYQATIRVSRFFADAYFRWLMHVYGAPLPVRWIAWAGVRIGGRRAYAAGGQSGTDVSLDE